MKQTLKTILSVMLILVMVFTVAGCNDKNTGSETNATDAGANDDFFTDTTETVEGEDADGNSSSGKDSGKDTNKDSGKDTNKDSNKVSGSSAPAENKIGGKSWDEVKASMPKKLKGTTVVMYNWNPASEYTGAPAVIERFEKDTGIKVKWNTINFEVYNTRLAALVASNEAPDMVRTRLPVPDRLQSFQPLSTANYDFTDAAWDQVLMKDYTINGVCYATSLKNTHLGSVDMMFYNKSLISKYDLENPYTLWKNGKWTTSKFLEICREYKKLSNADVACVGAFWHSWSELYGYAGTLRFDGNKFYSNLGDSKFLTVTQEIADLWNTEKLITEGRAEVFDAGDCLFYTGGSVYLRKKNSYFGKLKASGQFYAVPMPAVDGQSTYYQGKDEYEAYAIANGAKNPEAVPYFLRYFLDGTNYDLDNFFCNKQNLEAYNWAMSQENTVWPTYYTGKGEFNSAENGILTKNGSQIKSFFDANAALVQQEADTYNEGIKKLVK